MLQIMWSRLYQGRVQQLSMLLVTSDSSNIDFSFPHMVDMFYVVAVLTRINAVRPEWRILV